LPHRTVTTGADAKVAAASPTLKLRLGVAPLLTIPHINLIPAITNVPEGRPSPCPVIATGVAGVIPTPLSVGADRIPPTGRLPMIACIVAGPLQVRVVHVTPPVVTPAAVTAPAATIAPELEIAPTTWGFPAVETWS